MPKKNEPIIFDKIVESYCGGLDNLEAIVRKQYALYKKSGRYNQIGKEEFIENIKISLPNAKKITPQEFKILSLLIKSITYEIYEKDVNKIIKKAAEKI